MNNTNYTNWEDNLINDILVSESDKYICEKYGLKENTLQSIRYVITMQTINNTFRGE